MASFQHLQLWKPQRLSFEKCYHVASYPWNSTSINTHTHTKNLGYIILILVWCQFPTIKQTLSYTNWMINVGSPILIFKQRYGYGSLILDTPKMDLPILNYNHLCVASMVHSFWVFTCAKKRKAAWKIIVGYYSIKVLTISMTVNFWCFFAHPLKTRWHH